jgi:hypothetical protein
MKKKCLQIVLALTMCILAGAQLSIAQGYRQAIRIPFDFTVNDQLIEAGDYTVELLAHAVLLIRYPDGRPITSVMTHSATLNQIPEKSTLVFNRYKNDYFLSKIFWAGFSGGREVAFSQRETLLAAKHAPRTTVALNEK